MAKRKTPKAKKPTKLTNEELDKLQSLVNNINNHQITVGRHETQKHQVLHMLGNLNDKLTLMRGDLENKYGTDDINILDGTINKNETN